MVLPLHLLNQLQFITDLEEGKFGMCVAAGLISLVLHLDKHLGNIIAEQGRGRAYALLAGIVFCETGLVRLLE